ncbi:MAG: class I tRNA ligase family protein [Bacteroidota bacterium]|nr:class I tRNA ligase family protein [Bacteroidota bacterium]
MAQYDYRKIEENWQKVWAKNQTFKAENISDKPKYYVLDMFPYPSGAGLHVGHPLGYIASDIVSRYKRHQGFNVLHPMGYDAFGLPAEQYAIQTGQHPAITTEENIKRYREQLDRIGFSFDWSREIRTSNPDYYKWTQWIFIQLFNSWYNPKKDKAEPISELIKTFETNGYQSEELSFTSQEWKSYSEKQQSDVLLQFRLAFLSETMVNWCPALGSVLANDEIKDGVSERGGYPVERKLMYQWSLRISAYAERLLQGLNDLDWTESIKEAQRNWIGKSEGCSVRFELDESSKNSLEVFTTRPDTIFGVSYMAIAPEHELLDQLCVGEYREKALQYAAKAKNRSERERQAEVKNITGAFTGSYVKHPFIGKNIPIWIADYVLGGYGTGAVMAVPAHDGRDYSFAKHFGLPILEVVQGGDKDKNEVTNKLHITSPLTPENQEENYEPYNTSPLTPLQRRGEQDADSPFGYYTTDKITYSKLIDFAREHRSKPTKEEEKIWDIIRNRQILDTKFRRQHIIDKFIADFVCLELNFIIEIDGLIHSLEDNLISDEARTIRLNELGFEVVRFTNEEVNSNIESVISKLELTISEKKSSSPSLLEKGLGDEVFSMPDGLDDVMKEPYEAKQGKIINSDFLNGLEVKEAIKAAIKAIEQKGIGKGKTNYRLRDAVFGRQRYWGEPIPVYYENNIPKTFDEKDLPLVLPEIDKYLPTETGEPPLSRAKEWDYKGNPIETTTMPGWAGSSWYFLRYMDHNNAQELVTKQAVDYWQNIDLYVGGSEHATGHLLYFRFWTKFLNDIGIIPFDEPAKKLVNQGMIQGVSPFLRGVHTVTYSKSFLSLNEIEQQKLIFDLKKDTTNEKHIKYVSKDYLSNYIEYENNVEIIVSEYVHLRLPLELEIDNSFVNEDELLRLVLDLDLPNKINYFPNKFLKRFFEESIVFEKDKNDKKVIQVIWEIEKMSKSKWNVVNPDDVCNEYGADTLRLYEMFLGPLQDAKPWSTQGIEGVLRFLRKLWRLFHQGENESFLLSDEKATKVELKILHKTIKKATEDIENFSFNTSVSAFMVCVNELQDLKCNKREILEPLITLLSPYAPHICEELWALSGHDSSIEYQAWPQFNAEFLVENEFNYPISFNGKVRFNLLFALDKDLKEIENEVLANEQTLKYLEGKQAKKVIVVKGKIVNVVV